MRLSVRLPKNRADQGYFLATRDGKILCHGFCLGKADNQRARDKGNASRDQTRPFGDTPAGEYHPTRAVIYAGESEKYGKGHIPLEGKAGNALRAHENGRTGIWIHAGPTREDGRLRPTYGCLRVSPESFVEIILAGAGGLIDVVITEEI